MDPGAVTRLGTVLAAIDAANIVASRRDDTAAMLFGAGREKRIYAIPPYTKVESLGFEDYPFEVQSWEETCALCAAEDSYMDEIVLDDAGRKMYVCSDSHYCAERRDAGHEGWAAKDDTAKALLEGDA